MERPTDQQLLDAQEVLEWLEDWFREHEPTATSAIRSLENARADIPDSADELVAD